MRPSRFLAPYVSVARRALLLLVAVGLGVGFPVAVPPRASAVQSSCGILFNCVTLTLDPFGTGSGTIVATDKVDAITCRFTNGVLTGTCIHQYKWSGTGMLALVITYTPDAHTMLCSRMSSTCSGSGVSETGNLNIGTNLPSVTWHEYMFQLVSETLTVTRTGVGSGTVASSLQPGISCGATCSAQFGYGTAIKLTAKPDAGAVFTAWTGACAGQGKTCTLKLTNSLATNAVFSLPSPPPAPTPRPTAAATPRPTAAPTAAVPSAAPTAAPPTAAPATAAPPSSSPEASAGLAGTSPSPAGSGLTAAVVPTPPVIAPTAPPQTPLPAAADAGVPVALVGVLVVMALLIGGLAAALALVLRRGKAS